MGDRNGLTDRQRMAITQLGLASVTLDVPLAPWTRLGLGGPCGALVEVATDDELALLSRWTRRERLPLSPLAHDTSRVVRAGGLPGVVMLAGAQWTGVGEDEAGWRLGGAAPAAALAGCGLASWMTGASTVAGCIDDLGRGSGRARVALDVVLGRGATQQIVVSDPDAPRLGLRDEAVVLGLTVSRAQTVSTADGAEAPGVRMFEEPLRGAPVAELLRRAGLAGVRIRGAQIDAEGRNRLTVLGTATDRDVSALIDWARGRIAGEWGVDLTPAIRMVGIAGRS